MQILNNEFALLDEYFRMNTTEMLIICIKVIWLPPPKAIESAFSC